jgi:isopenicillin-N epimerase
MSRVDPSGPLPARSDLSRHWGLEDGLVFLNHGSFGACPLAVLEQQSAFRAQLEREPIRFIVSELEPLLDEARFALAKFVNADPEGLAFVTNATTGVNAVMRNLRLAPGDELLTNNHEYNACNNALRFEAERAGARVIVAEVPFPIQSEDEVVTAILAAVTPRTRLCLLSHVTSATALIFPAERIVRELSARGVDTLLDGAHAPGMIETDVTRINAAYYTGNCHKWMCTPKGAAFLHVRADRRAGVEGFHPLVISHGYNSKRTDRSRFRLEADYMGTADMSPVLCIPSALAFMGSLLPGGWPEIRRRNRDMALAARDLLCHRLGGRPPAPDSMIGSIATIPLRARTDAEAAIPTRYHDALQDRLIERWRIQVPIVTFPLGSNQRWVRVSGQVYNTRAEYEYLARALLAEGAAPLPPQ